MATKNRCVVRSRPSGVRTASALLAAAAGTVLSATALAGPEGAQVVRGDVRIERSGPNTVIRAGDRSIINYNSFNIGANESVRFIQPDAMSRVLNRIQSASPTRIDGSLFANGRVYIVNPAGVVFGNGSVVNVNGLFAAAGSMTDRDFLRGVDRVTDMHGAVVNNGAITTPIGGSVTLAGGSVVNSGTIVAPQGTVAFAAGQSVVMGNRGSNLYARVDGSADNSTGSAITNTGTIDARGGRVLLAAGDVLGMAINTRGTVRGADIAIQGRGTGNIIAGGTIDASNQMAAAQRTPWVGTDSAFGGNIRIVGQNVALEGATVDASGAMGGGRVEIGGGYRGSGDIRAQVTAVNSATTIRADATQQGDGGQVVVWADHTTRTYGEISAKGGTQGGSGGTIETSGKQHLAVDGSRIDASAPHGKSGTWLMDPRNVSVTGSPTSVDGDFSTANPDVFTPNSDDSNVFAGDIESRLNAGTSVTITTGGTGSQDGDINILADITSNSASGTPTLRFEAANSIILDSDADITAAGGTSLNVDLIANTGAGDTTPNSGAVKILNGSSIVTNGGNIRIGGGSGDFSALGVPTDAGYAAALEASGARGTTTDPTGVLVDDGIIDAGSGSVEIRGVGARTGDAPGVVFSGGSTVSGATVQIHGAGGLSASGDNNAGVRVDSSSLVTASTGGLNIRGLGRGDQNAAGVHIQGTVTTSGTAAISVVGASTATGDAGHGVFLEAGSISSNNGTAIAVTGTGAGTNQSDGVRLADGAAIASNAAASTLTVTGSGSGTSGVGLAMEGSSVNSIGGTGASLVVVEADSASFFQSQFTGSESFVIRPHTPGTSMGVGTGVAGTLALNDAAVALLSGYSDVTFGGTNAGTVRTSALDFSANAADYHFAGTRLFTGGLHLGSGRNLSLDFTDSVTQTGAVIANELELLGSARFTLDHNANNIDVFAANVTGATQYVDLDGFSVGIASGTSGITNTAGVNLTAQSGTISVVQNIASGAGGMTLRADEVDIDPTAGIASTGALYIVPFDVGADVRVGNTADGGAGLDLTAAELATISGTGLLAVGLESGTGTLTVPEATTFSKYTLLRMGGSGGIVETQANVRSTGGGLALLGATNRIGGNITATGGDVIVGGSSLLTSNVVIDATDGGAVAAGGNVDLRGTVNADAGANDRSLTINNGTSAVTLADVGNNDALSSVSINAGQINLHDVRTKTAQSYTGPAALNGDLRSLDSGDIMFQNAVTLAGDSSVRTSGNSGDDVTFRSTVTGANDLTVNTGSGNTILFGDVSGDAVDFTSPVVLERDVAVSGTTSVRFGGTVNSFANEQNDLTVNSPTTTFGGAVGAGTNGILGAVRTDSTGTTTINGGQVLAQNAVQFLDDVVLGAATTVTSSTANVEFAKTVQSDGAARALTVNGPTGVRFGQGVGTSSGLASVTVDGNTTLGGSVTTSGVQNYMDNVVLAGDSTINASQLTIAGTLNSDSTPRDLIVNTSGSTTFGGEIGTTSVLDTVDVTATNIVLGKATTRSGQRYAGITTLSGDVRSTTSGPITFAGDLILTSNVTVASAGQAASDDINFQGKIDSQGSSRNLTVSAGQGDVTFGDAVGTTSTLLPIATLNASGASVAMKNVRTSASQVYTGVTTLTGNLTTTGTGAIAIGGALTLASDATITTASGDVVFGGTVNSDATARNLTVNTGNNGATRFVSAIGNNLRLASVTTNADGVTRIEGSQVRSTGDLTFNDNVILGTNASMEANDITFGGTLNSDSTSTPRNLTLNTSTNSTTTTDTGETAFAGLVGGSARLGLLTTNADGTTRIGDSIFTARGAAFNDAVVLVGQNITIDGSTGPLTFKGTINADTSITDPNLVLLSAAAGDADNPAFRFGANIGATRRLGSLAVGADRATAQSGTIIFTDALDSQNRIAKSGVAATDAFTITVGTGGFSVGGGQKIVALGSLTVTTTGTARFGDVTALNNFTVNAASIRLRNRNASAVQSPTSSNFTRTINDAGSDLIAGGSINFSVAPTFEGTGGNFAYSTGSRQQDPELAGVVYREPLTAITSSRFEDPRATTFLLGLDLIASGPSTTAIGPAIIMPVPPVGAPPTDFTRAGVDAPLAQELADIGIDIRPRSTRDIVDSLSGRTFETDLPASVGPTGLTWQVSSRRVDPAAARSLLSEYRALMLGTRTNDDGTTTTVNRADEIKQDLAASWDRYAEQVKLTSGLGWRAWLDSMGTTGSTEDTRARDALVRLQRIVLSIEDMGLAPDEAKPAIARILGEVRPAQVSPTDFEQAVRAVLTVSSR